MSELGVDDFGAGKAMVVASMCQRYAKLPQNCEACIQGCPIDAFKPQEYTLFTDNACLHCGACVSMCPMNALGAVRQSIQEVSRKLLDATLQTSNLVLTCQRTRYLANLTQGSNGAPDETSDGVPDPKHLLVAEQLNQAEADGILRTIPCLAMLPAPIWFALLNEIEVTSLENLGVLLPSGQCANCPVNAKGGIEDLIDGEIVTAEQWAKSNVGLYCASSELPAKADASLLGFLRSPDEPDRRAALTGVFRGIKSSWNELANRDNQALQETQIKRQRRDAYQRTLLGKNVAARSLAQSTAAPQATITPSRYQLVEALGRNSNHASDVVLTVSKTDGTRCLLCQKCIDTCSLHARSLVTDETEDQATAQIICSELHCVGCGSCLLVCTNDAITLANITGESFLL